jgi:hypothetical protein
MSSLRNPSKSWNGNSARAQYSLAIGSTSARRKSRTRVLYVLFRGGEQLAEVEEIVHPIRYPPWA